MSYKNPEENRMQTRKWAAENRDKVKAMNTAYRTKHRKSLAYRQHLSRLEKKKELFSLFGELCCLNCRIDDIDVLTLDHIDDDGAYHRTELKLVGQRFYNEIRKSGYKRLQILCWNCNIKKERLRKRAKLRSEAEAEDRLNESAESSGTAVMVTGSVKRGYITV